jgi:hypothetical protein
MPARVGNVALAAAARAPHTFFGLSCVDADHSNTAAAMTEFHEKSTAELSEGLAGIRF